MKLKKLTSLLLVAVMAVSMAACGSNGNEAASNDTKQEDGEEKLVVWTITNDQVTQAKKWEEETGNKAEVTVIEPGDYPTKIQAALVGGATEPDIIVGEPKMLDDFFDAGFFEDLNQAPYNAQDYADQVVDYVWQVGQDSEGIQRAIAYQITPAGIFYRRDIAKEVFGTDDPEEVGKLFADYPTILDTANKVKDAGYRLFASDAEMNVFSTNSAWVEDGVLNVDQARLDYMDLCVELYQKDLTAYAAQWATPWYQAMSGPVPILDAETQWGTDEMDIWNEDSFNEATEGMETTEVMAYGLPAWGVLTLRDNVGETSGKWGVCTGPSSGFDGGTYLGISSQSKKKDLAWDFIKFCTLNEDTAEWWIKDSQGDTVSLKAILEKHKDDENEIYGGEKLYDFFLKQAEEIDYSKVTRYDKAIGDLWGKAISKIKTGELSKEDAIADFYDQVEKTYVGEVKVNR